MSDDPDDATDDPVDAEGQQPSAEPYEEITDPSYTGFADSCEIVERKGGFSIIGTCPRCGHRMTYPYPKRVVGRGIGIRRRSPSREHELAVLCTCTQEHPGPPDHEHGCGAYWKVALQDSAT